MDTGVDLSHEDLAAKIVAGHDFVDGDGDPSDEHGHGTHVAGVAAAVTGNGRGVAGVAPGARVMPVRVLDADGEGSGADVVAGVRWAVDHGADVVNLSLGRATQQVLGSGLDEAVRYAWARRVVVVVAAGNDYVLSSGFADEPALVVSATTREDRKPDYSSGVGEARWGIAAPGGGCELVTCPVEDDVFSTWWDPGQADVYAYQAGTSMAAPHVAGGAAILRSAGLSPQQTVDRLLETAVDLGPQGRDSTYGAGRIDLAAAVAGLEPTPKPSAPPSASPSSSPAPSASPSPSASPTSSPSPRGSPIPSPSASPTPGPSPTSPGSSSSPTGSPSDDPGPEAAASPGSDPPSPSPLSPGPPPASPTPGGSTPGSDDPTAGAAPVPDAPDSPAGPPSATDPVQGAGDAAPARDNAGAAPEEGGSGVPVVVLFGGTAALAAAGAWRRHRRR